MSTCSPSDLLNANPFVGLSAGQKLAAECELVRQWAGSSETVSQILARAWDFKNLSEGTALAVEAGLLAEIAGESNPYVLLQNNGFVSLDSGLVWSAKLARLQELAGHSGDIDSLFLNNHFESIDQGLARSAKLRLLCDLASGATVGSSSGANTAEKFVDYVAQLGALNWQPNLILTTFAGWSNVLKTVPSGGSYSVPGGITIDAQGNIRMMGIPVIPHSLVTASKAYVLDTTKFSIAQQSGLAVRSTEFDQDDFVKNLITFRCEARCDLMSFQPTACLYGNI